MNREKELCEKSDAHSDHVHYPLFSRFITNYLKTHNILRQNIYIHIYMSPNTFSEFLKGVKCSLNVFLRVMASFGDYFQTYRDYLLFLNDSIKYILLDTINKMQNNFVFAWMAELEKDLNLGEEKAENTR